MNLLTYLSRQSWKLLLFSTIASIVSGLGGAALVTIIGDGIGDNSPNFQRTAAFFIICLIFLLSKSYATISLVNLSQTATLHLRVDLSKKLLATPYKKIRSIGKSELLAILTNDVMTFTQIFQNIPLIFSEIILIFVCLGYMAWLSLPLFLIFSAILAAGILAYHFAERGPVKNMTELRSHIDNIYENYQSLIDGARELQLNRNRGELFVDRVVRPGAVLFNRLFVSTMTGYAWIGSFGSVGFFLLIGIFLFVIPGWISVGLDVTSKFTLILLYLIGPIGNLISGIPLIQQAAISLKKIQILENELIPDSSTLAGSSNFPTKSALKLELLNVCHQYDGKIEDDKFLLGPLNLTVNEGEIIFLVGGNGTGKTTLAMLLLGFFEPETGQIALNGVAVDAENIHDYRKNFSAVFSDFHLFEHIFDGEKNGLSERAAYYLKKFHIDHKVKIVDEKFSTIDLSTGQRKRLALVSAYLEDRAIYLFDEWAADQDPEFKRVFYTELLPEMKSRGKTILIITHDDGYFSCADRVLRIEDGMLKEDPSNAVDEVTRLQAVLVGSDARRIA